MLGHSQLQELYIRFQITIEMVHETTLREVAPIELDDLYANHE